MKFAFEDLKVWQKSICMVKDVYIITKSFPQEEKYGITSQIRRSALSVTCNLAEGSWKITGKDKANFSAIAYGSLMETINLMIVAHEVEMVSKEKLDELRSQISEISRMLSGLRNSQLKES